MPTKKLQPDKRPKDRKEYQRNWYLKNIEHARKYQREYGRKHSKRRIARNYGTTAVQLDALIQSQNFKCAICSAGLTDIGIQDPNVHVDHDHSTGRIRGVLCRRCNLGLGMFGDSKSTVEKAFNYLSK